MTGGGVWALGSGDSHGVAGPEGECRSGTVESFRDLDVWKDGVALAEAIYQETQSFPRGEEYGLTSQLRRAAGSMPSNTAEGWGRSSRADYLRLYVARGSLFEVATQVEIAQRVGLLSPGGAGRIERQGALCGKRLSRLIAALKRPQPPVPNP